MLLRWYTSISFALVVGCGSDSSTSTNTGTESSGGSESGSESSGPAGSTDDTGTTESTGSAESSGSTSGGPALDCSMFVTAVDCEAAEGDIGGGEMVGACAWRETAIVDPATCEAVDGPGACFNSTALDGCFSDAPITCPDGEQAWFFRELADGSVEVFEDASGCAGSQPFESCEDAASGDTNPDSPGSQACSCVCSDA